MSKVALVTGATRGIGKQIAITLAKEGYNIALNYRKDNDELTNTKKEIENQNVKCLCVKGDVSNFEDCENFVKETINEYGNIDVLVNNAGITKDMLLMRMKKEDFQDFFVRLGKKKWLRRLFNLKKEINNEFYRQGS